MIRQGRRDKEMVKAGVAVKDLPPPIYQQDEVDDRVPCPHCGRSFNEKVSPFLSRVLLCCPTSRGLHDAVQRLSCPVLSAAAPS